MRLRLRNLSNKMTERVQLTISTTATTILFSKSRMMFFIIKLKQQIQTERCQGLRKLTRKTWTAISLECQTFEHLRLRIEFFQLQEIKVLTLLKIIPDISSKYLNYLSRRQESHLYLVWLRWKCRRSNISHRLSWTLQRWRKTFLPSLRVFMITD